MSTGWIITIVVILILIGAMVGLYFFGKRAEKKKVEQDEQLAAAAQTVSMLIIDKKRMKIKDSGLPDAVIDQMPFYAKRAKFPIVKAKVGPRIMTLICDGEIFDEIPIKKEVKATVSGLYITKVRGLHGKTQAQEEKKKGVRAWLLRKLKNLQDKAANNS